MHWHWNSVNVASMSLPKDVLNNFAETWSKTFHASKLLFLCNLLYLCKISTTRLASLTNQWIGKAWSEGFLVIPDYGLKSMKHWIGQALFSGIFIHIIPVFISMSLVIGMKTDLALAVSAVFRLRHFNYFLI